MVRERQTDRQTDRQLPYRYYYDKLCGIGKYSKSKNEGKIRWQQSKIGDNVGNVDERQTESDPGEYP